MLKQFLQEEEGMEMVEWALVAVLFALVAGGAFTALSGDLTESLVGIGQQIAPQQ